MLPEVKGAVAVPSRWLKEVGLALTDVHRFEVGRLRRRRKRKRCHQLKQALFSIGRRCPKLKHS